MINVSVCSRCDAVTSLQNVFDAYAGCIAKYCFASVWRQHTLCLTFCVFSSLRRGTVSQSVTLIQCRCERNFKHHLLDYMTEIQCGKMCEMIDSIHFSASETNDERKKKKRKCNEMYHISCDFCAHSIRYGYLEYRLFLAGTFTSICHLISSVHLILICCKGLRYTQTHCRKHYGNFYV